MNLNLNKKTALLIFSIFLFLILVVGCNPSGPGPTNQTPIITSTPDTSATVNQTYTYNVTATDPDGDTLTFSLTISPAGMTINSTTGLINWTPTATGYYDVTVEVSDNGSPVKSITQSFTIHVEEDQEPINHTPTITSTPDTTATINQTYAYNVDATDPDGDTLTYSLTTSPAGMTINSITGLINWTPTATGDYDVTVEVSDNGSPVKSITQSFTIHVEEDQEPTNQAPTITSTPDTTATVNQTYAYNVDATDPDGDTLTYSLTTSPAGMTINSWNGIINWTPTALGDYDVTVKVSDGDLIDNQSFTITVIPPPALVSISVSPAIMNIDEGDSESITLVTAHYDDGSSANIALANCDYDSDDTAIATVNGNGVISGVSAGNATITVSYTEGGITKNDTVEVTVVGITPKLKLTPSTQSVTVGNQANIDVVVEDVTDLKEASITLNFDSTKLQYASSTDGGFIPSAFLAPATVDNVNGSVTLDIAGLAGPASSTGTIITVKFDAIATTNPPTDITFGTTQLRDKDNNPITHTEGSGCSVTITNGVDKPTVITNNASNITSTSAQLNGNLDSTGNLSCQVWFEYGKTTSYGSSTSKQSKSSTGSFNQAISSLDPNTTYHFRACASNTEGTAYGDDKTFTTPPTTTNLELTPSTQSVTVGNQANIDVVVEDVTDLKGASITLNFDATKLQYASSTDGGFIPSAFLAPATVDNVNGSVTLYIAGLAGPASGTGTIITVKFDTIATANPTNITFGTTQLRDQDNNPITHTKGSGCKVTIN